MIKRLAGCLLLNLLLSLSANADEPAQVVRTAGVAQLENVHDFLLFAASSKTPARVPGLISAGTSIRIAYLKDGQVTEEDFPATEIYIRGNLCWIESKPRDRYDLTQGDRIYVQPCTKLR
ncbi:hypothetical protein OKW30_002552 [Paraburkholderia sp. Clong3]